MGSQGITGARSQADYAGGRVLSSAVSFQWLDQWILHQVARPSRSANPEDAVLGRQTTDRGGSAHAPMVMIRNRRNRRYGLDHQGLEGSRGAAVVVFATLASDPRA